MKNSANITIRPVEKIIEWHDSEPTGARGWIVIDCLINGVSGGGLFMHSNATEREVTDLARTMTFKNGLQRPQFGGGKGGIKFDPQHPEAKNVLKRFLIDNKQYVENLWCTGADLNTSNEVIHNIIQQDLGLESGFHCLGKMLNNRFGIEDQSRKMLSRIKERINPIFPLSESATGFTVAKCIETLGPKNARIILQGFGAVGKSAAYFTQIGELGSIVGITEVNGFIYNEDGIDVAALFANKNNEIIGEKLENFLDDESKKRYNWNAREEQESNEEYLIRFLSSVKANVFCPCAMRYPLTGKVLETLLQHTFKDEANPFIICGANNIYDTPETFEAVQQSAITTIPEWVSNCGNALLFMEALKSEDNGPQWVENFLNDIDTRLEGLFSNFEHSEQALSMHQQCYDLMKKRIDIALNNIEQS